MSTLKSNILCVLISVLSLLFEYVEAADAPLWADRSHHEDGFITANGIRLHYLDWGGAGESILFLHGLGDTAHIFDDLAPMFTDRFHVIGLTRRGHGRSEKPETNYDLATLVEDIRCFLDALGIERVVLVGHSVAGDELTQFAGRYPDRVVKLVYLDAAHDRTILLKTMADAPPELSPSKTDMKSLDSFRRWVSQMSFWSEAWEANLREMMVLAPDGKILREAKPLHVSRLVLEGTQRPNYSQIRAPALNFATIGFSYKVRKATDALPEPRRKLVEAYLERFRKFQQQEVQRFRREVRNGTVIELDDTDHHCFIQRQIDVVREMQAFLAR